MKTKHIQLKSAAKRPNPLFTIMQGLKFLPGKTQVCKERRMISKRVKMKSEQGEKKTEMEMK